MWQIFIYFMSILHYLTASNPICGLNCMKVSTSNIGAQVYYINGKLEVIYCKECFSLFIITETFINVYFD